MTDFRAELDILLRAPYTYIQIVTPDEPRAIAAVIECGGAQQRTVRQWSLVRGFDDDGADPTSLHGALEAFEAETTPAIYVFKDAHSGMSDPWVVRKLREIESLAAAMSKTLVFVGAIAFHLEELAADVTTVYMPLPERPDLDALSEVVFPSAQMGGAFDRESLISAALGLTSRQALRAFHRVRLSWQAAHAAGRSFSPPAAMLAEKRRLAQGSQVVEFVDVDRGLDDVGGMGQLKRWLSARRDAFSEKARSFGLPAPRGLLMLGVQGCGKSLMAKVVASYFGMPLLRLEISALFGGDQPPDAALKSAIRTATALKPVVLWLDEIEKVFEEQGDGSSRLLGSLLTWLQEKTDPIFFVATANRVEDLPPELLRKGRFDEVFFVDLPDQRARQQILEIFIRRHGRATTNLDTTALAKEAANFSGAELEQVVVSALYSAYAREGELAQADLEAAIKQTVPLFKTYEENIKALREWARHRTRFAADDTNVLDYFGGDLPKTRR